MDFSMVKTLHPIFKFRSVEQGLGYWSCHYDITMNTWFGDTNSEVDTLRMKKINKDKKDSV